MEISQGGGGGGAALLPDGGGGGGSLGEEDGQDKREKMVQLEAMIMSLISTGVKLKFWGAGCLQSGCGGVKRLWGDGMQRRGGGCERDSSSSTPLSLRCISLYRTSQHRPHLQVPRELARPDRTRPVRGCDQGEFGGVEV